MKRESFGATVVRLWNPRNAVAYTQPKMYGIGTWAEIDRKSDSYTPEIRHATTKTGMEETSYSATFEDAWLISGA